MIEFLGVFGTSVLLAIAILAAYHFWPETKAAHIPSHQQPEIIYPEWTGEDYKG